MFAFQLGAAVKPSTLGLGKAEALVKLAKTLSKQGYTYLLVDSEREGNDPSREDISEVVRFCKAEGLCTPVFTLPVRRRDFRDRFQAVLKSLAEEGFGGLCLVAGNPAYLSEDELRVKAGPMILEAASRFREKAKDLTLFVGSENMLKISHVAARLYKAIPLALLGPKLEEEKEMLSASNGGFGIYVPYYVGEGCRDAWERLAAYVKRRNTNLSVEKAVHAYGLYGDLTYITERIKYLEKISVGQVFGYPLVPSEQQLALFASVFEHLLRAPP